MRKALITAALAVAVVSTAGCTDAEMANMFAYGDQADVKCYSGGQAIFEDVSTGKVVPIEGDGFTYKSAKSGKLVRAFADCILIVR
jgi:uncharacterized membrane protein